MSWPASVTRKSGSSSRRSTAARADALHNVELPLIYAGLSARIRRSAAAHALERVGLADRMDHKPNELSGASASASRSARALVTSTSILLADEPTGNLDSTRAPKYGRLAELAPSGQTCDGHARADIAAAARAALITLRDRRGGRRPGPGGLTSVLEAFRLAIQTIRAQKLKSGFSLLGVFIGSHPSIGAWSIVTA